ncbi:MAG: antitoxin VapB family protein [Verrucomicrobia bacterium]|nr:antitoxin VapB family protein [Verrucomicrobiota bacterium]
MAIKTISLELDAYEKLRRMKRGNESFSSVVRRAEFPAAVCTGEFILQQLSTLYQRKDSPSASTFAYWQKAQIEDTASPRISPSKWDGA